MPERAAIFDMDGVLVDSYHAHFESWRKLAAAHGVEMTEQQFAVSFGMTSREIIRRLWPHAVKDADVPAWDAEKEALYRQELIADFPEGDGASELLRQLHSADFALAIGSSGPPENVAVVRRLLQAGNLLTATVDGFDVKHGKPEPDIFLRAADKLHVQPDCCVVVEDAPVGIQAAHRAGMAVAAVTGTVARGQLAEADLIVDSLRELSPKILCGLIDRRQATRR